MASTLSFKTEIIIILSTAYYNITSALILFYLGFTLPDTEWYKSLYFLIGLIILSYPVFHLRDRLKDRRVNGKE